MRRWCGRKTIIRICPKMTDGHFVSCDFFGIFVIETLVECNGSRWNICGINNIMIMSIHEHKGDFPWPPMQTSPFIRLWLTQGRCARSTSSLHQYIWLSTLYEEIFNNTTQQAAQLTNIHITTNISTPHFDYIYKNIITRHYWIQQEQFYHTLTPFSKISFFRPVTTVCG